MGFLRGILTGLVAVGCLAMLSIAAFADNGQNKGATAALMQTSAGKETAGNKKLMKGFETNIEEDTLENDKFRKVIYTGKYSQLVLMSLLPKQEIGIETHMENDQFFRFEKGQAKVIIDGTEYNVSDGTAVVVPAGAKHNVINTSDTEELKLYAIYSPPHHKDGIVRGTKREAEANSQEFDGKTTE